MLLAELVATSDSVGATPARSAKVAALAALLARLAPAEIPVAVAMLSGEPRQRRLGVGWRTIAGVDVEPAAAPSLSIAELDATLDALAACAGPGSAGERAGLLKGLLGRATPAEQAFLRRLLVGELRQGALEGVMADAVARAAAVPVAAVRRAAMLAGDLARTAEVALIEGSAGLARIGLTVGRPVGPMLASTAPDVATALAATGTASVEWKLDGARVQVHRLGDDVGVFTRNLNDVTARVPGIVAAARALRARAFVIDGETIGMDGDERPGMFQDTMSRLTRHDAAEGSTSLAARFFDILHLDGEDLLDRPLHERGAALAELVGPWKVPGVVTDGPVEAEAVLAQALAAGHEGVMVKAAGSTYAAGRRGKAWLKVKPVRTLDLVVIGVEWGSGRRRGLLSNLHLGARDPSSGQFVMVGKTFKGLTDELLAWQTEQLLAREVAQHGHVVHVRPELVVEIAVDGVQVSSRYAGGVALRFARVRRYRADKDPQEADTIDAVRALVPR